MKLKSGPFKGMEVVICDQDVVDQYEDIVDEILDCIGIRAALVTDRSELSDFGCDDSVARVNERFGPSTDDRSDRISGPDRSDSQGARPARSAIMRIDYHEYALETVMDYFANGFKTKKGETIHSIKWYIDPMKGVAIFKILVDEAKPE